MNEYGSNNNNDTGRELPKTNQSDLNKKQEFDFMKSGDLDQKVVFRVCALCAQKEVDPPQNRGETLDVSRRVDADGANREAQEELKNRQDEIKNESKALQMAEKDELGLPHLAKTLEGLQTSETIVQPDKQELVAPETQKPSPELAAYLVAEIAAMKVKKLWDATIEKIDELKETKAREEREKQDAEYQKLQKEAAEQAAKLKAMNEYAYK